MTHGHASMQSLLGGLLKNRQLVAGMRRVMVLSLWEQVVGAIVAKKSWPEKVSNGVLAVGVSSHAWASELHLLKPQILARYRQLLGRNVLKEIEFHVGRRKPRPLNDIVPTVALHPARDERLRIEPAPTSMFTGVDNAEVRELLAPLFARLRAQREWKEEHGWARCESCQRIYHGASCPTCNTRPDAA